MAAPPDVSWQRDANPPEPIAVVGTACRFPGTATSMSKFSELLRAPLDLLRELPPNRLNLRKFSDSDGASHGETNCPTRAYLLEDDPRHFDAAFFRISPKEAHGMDPQQRILLEVVYEALEAAGWPLEAIDGSDTSVHVGVMTSDYNDLAMRDPDALQPHATTGVARSLLSNRISYFFNLKGPSLTIDTACSSSLVALHQAVQGLRSGEATSAIVAGTGLLLDPAMFIAESKLNLLSPDSRSRMFDSNANGYARGEGCAAIVLKPLSAALRDGDRIDCIIRNTGVGSNGRTNGITMPSWTAQSDLIRRTYVGAGLDIIKDRCQYFECHGTGTPAGDPIEAQAIYETFFPGAGPASKASEKLYCGSVKTVIGHLEGCAGLAGLLKAALAIQHKQIFPNMHFNNLNPAIEPFSHRLVVPTACQPWPEIEGQPLRASVNSFGLGGMNSHVILEGYQPREDSMTIAKTPSSSTRILPFPFTFSAKTSKALLRLLQDTTTHLRLNRHLNLDALSWTLQTRRSNFPVRTAVVASDRDELLTGLNKQIEAFTTSIQTKVPEARPSAHSNLLGIFTGQGAQWPAMGRELMRSCHLFAESLKRCQLALASIHDAPSWLLMDELAADDSSSRVDEAEISQPLCTAVQIALVDLLSAARIHFDVVIGHSSGEIGAAYAAGLINTRDAMGVAYYRGLVSRYARGKEDQKGGMIAVGISPQAARKFCSQSRFIGRICVAASNSPSAVTLAGDIDAIQQAKDHFDKENTFARLLQVNVAYHSPHMAQCATIYAEHLKRLDVKMQSPTRSCKWVSTVHPGIDMTQGQFVDQFAVQYWVDNLVSPVSFAEALELCWASSGPFNLMLEVGPHAALKGPVNQVLKEKVSSLPPYLSCLKRQSHDEQIISSTLASLWQHTRGTQIDFRGWRAAFGVQHSPAAVQDLPSYPWDHEQLFWSESRRSRNYRLGNQPNKSLLGSLWEDCTDEMTWRNLFNAHDKPWVRGHCFQGQCLFPAAGYVMMAVQAAAPIARGRHVQLIEIQDLEILKGMVVPEDGARLETIFTIRVQSQHGVKHESSTIQGDFVCHFSSDERVVDTSCRGRISIHLDVRAASNLPPSSLTSTGLLRSLDVDRFYSTMQQLGIQYDGIFRSIEDMSRTSGLARVSASWPDAKSVDSDELWLALLDVAFQAGFATFTSMAEGAVGSAYLPAGIRRLLIDPAKKFQSGDDQVRTLTAAHLANSASGKLEIDLDVFDNLSDVPGIQVDGLMLKAVAEPPATQDRKLFAKTVWDVDASYGLPSPARIEPTQLELAYIDAVERSALFYLQNVSRMREHFGDPRQLKRHHKVLLDTIPDILESIERGNHPVLRKEWLNDSPETIENLGKIFPESIDLALLKAVGENLPDVISGGSEMLEHMIKDDLLGRLYVEGRGFDICNKNVANILRTICFKYPRAKILEIGAGTGGTTQSVLDAIGTTFKSYTYTDISAGFFDKAAEKFADHVERLSFKTFNAESPPLDQGFDESSYDIVIAANVLHATRNLATTLRHVRSLLRPGGFLVTVEVTGSMLRETGLMGGLEGWWLGREEGRVAGPGVSTTEWHRLLRSTGFSGIEAVMYDMPDVARHNCSVFYSHATDELWETLRHPLTSPTPVPKPKVLILGGRTLAVAKQVSEAERTLRRHANITTMATIDDFAAGFDISPGTFVLSFLDLEGPFFAGTVTSSRLDALQKMFSMAHGVLWTTRGCRSADPFANMMVGIGRALVAELPHVPMQFLDLDVESSPFETATVSTFFLRLIYSSSPVFAQHDMLWQQEAETQMKGTSTIIPRVIADDNANNKLNARRRVILKRTHDSLPIEVVLRESRTVLAECQLPSITHGAIKMRVDRSVSLYGPSEEPQFLCLGQVDTTGRPALALSPADRSHIVQPQSSILELDSDFEYSANDLACLAASVIALVTLRSCASTGTIVINEPPPIIADAIALAATRACRQVLFLSASPKTDNTSWITIHPFARAESIRRQIPTDAKSFVQMSTSTAEHIISCLPRCCQVRSMDFRNIEDPKALLVAAADVCVTCRSRSDIPVFRADAIHGQPFNSQLMPFIMDWTAPRPRFVTIEPIPTDRFFSPNKTYFLVGMTGEMGQSLCNFMARSGGRHFVLASRNPDLESKWLEHLKTEGVQVRVVAMDVTDPRMVRDVATMMRRTMPPIGGVANGALVLQDSSFVNTTADAVAKQLRPKVDGTQLLHDEFSSDELDFFLVFSSLGSIYGNAGQSIYHAANMFMTSLIEKRQLEGLAGSVMHLGMISDLGYVARMERTQRGLEARLRAQNYAPLSETDFHEMVLQAILAGRPGSTNPEVIMGIEDFVDEPDAQTRPSWYDVPRMSHFIKGPTALAPNSANLGAGKAERLLNILESANNAAEAKEALQELLCQRLEAMIMQPAATIDIEGSLFEFGVDSLVAIELRGWFLKTTGANVPLLTIMGRESIASVCSGVAEIMFSSESDMATAVASPQEDVPSVKELDETVYSSLDLSNSSSTISSINGDDFSVTDTTSNAGMGEPSQLPGHTSNGQSKLELVFPAEDSPLTESQMVDIGTNHDLDFSRVEVMSYAQAGLFFMSNLLNDPTNFNVTAHYTISGPLDIDRFTHAFQRTISRHEAYRTCFYLDASSSEPRQGILNSNARLPIRLKHLNDPSEEGVPITFQEFAKRHWKLGVGEAFQATLLSHTPDSHSFIAGCNHIVMDGVSWHVFFNDLDREYRLQAPDPIQKTFADFAFEQNKALKSGRYQSSVDYWIRNIEDSPGVLPLLPFAQTRTRRERVQYSNHCVKRNLSLELTRGVRQISQKCQATVMQIYLAMTQAFFANFMNGERICIGVTDSGRWDPDLRHTIGHFSNLLPLCFSLDTARTMQETVQETSRIMFEGFEHAMVPFEKIMEVLGTARAASYPPIFQVAFNYRIGSLIQSSLGDCTLKLAKYEDTKLPYDITFTITEATGGQTLLEILTNDHLYSLSDSDMIADIYVDLLEATISDPLAKIEALKFATSARTDKALVLGRGPRMIHLWPDTMTERIRQIQIQKPDDVAFKDSTGSLTYKELQSRIELLASALVAKGAGVESHIAVICEPSIDTYVAMLAIFVAGAAYVPFDVALPAARHRAMSAVCKPSIILFHSATATTYPDSIATTESVESINLSDLPPADVPAAPKRRLLAGDPRYSLVLFTSGSTGKPKAIKLSQDGIMNYAASKCTELGLGRGLRVLQQSSTGFDMSVAQVFNGLANAGTVVVAPLTSRGDPNAIARLVLDESIDMTIATPSEYSMMATYAADILKQCVSWKFACSGGEVVTDAVISGLRRLDLPDLVFTDCYGPTETSCAASFYSIPLNGTTTEEPNVRLNSVGEAIPNVSLYILDDSEKLLPVGFAGELCIGGQGVAKGYIGEDADPQNASFVRDRFATIHDLKNGWDTMYKTGDMACLREDGTLVFLGRREGDSLVKLRGLRIDLDEVSNALLASETVSLAEAAVTVQGDVLVAYVVPLQDGGHSQELLHAACNEMPLPRYMIPSRVIAVDRLPKTANGKIDRRALSALPAPNGYQAEENTSQQIPLTVPEGEMRLIWRDVLGGGSDTLVDISRDTDFFQIGGSSLSLVRMQHTIRESMGIEIPLHQLYRHSTLGAVAAIASDGRAEITTATIDWEAETSIADSLASCGQYKMVDDDEMASNRRMKTQVLLTGATNFLGSEILKVMIKDEAIEVIHCIAVSPKAKADLETLDHKVRAYSGSLQSDSLGLSISEINLLKKSVDQIIHAGAQGHCLNNYASIRKANYNSTRFLATMAVGRRIPLHFISSGRVILQSGSHESRPISMAAHLPPSDGSQGFTSTKWASEKYLEKLSHATGLPVVIHRPCSVIGDQAPHDDAMNSIIRFSLESGSVPSVPHVEGYFDFKDVTEVARDIVSAFDAFQSNQKGGCTLFRHHSSGIRLPFAKLADRLKQLQGGRSFEIVDMDEWIRRARELGIEDLIVSYLKANVAAEQKLVLPYLGTIATGSKGADTAKQ